MDVFLFLERFLAGREMSQPAVLPFDVKFSSRAIHLAWEVKRTKPPLSLLGPVLSSGKRKAVATEQWPPTDYRIMYSTVQVSRAGAHLDIGV